MYFININEKSTFFYSKEIESIYAAMSILSEETKNPYYEKTYDLEFVEHIKKKYYFLYSLHQQVKFLGLGIIELLLNSEIENFNLSDFERQLLEMDKATLLFYFWGGDGEIKDFELAVKNKSCIELYDSLTYIKKNVPYLVFEILFLQTERVIKELITCTKEFQTDNFENEIKSIEPFLKAEEEKVRVGLLQKEPLEYSESLMGKTFKRRGPYKRFYFMPSIYSPYRCVRYMGEIQILFYSLNKSNLESKDIVKILKAISDETRFSILQLLSNEGPLIGKEIASRLSIATSTLSHHMEQLGSIGIIHEEKIKNSKYYSVNKLIRKELLDKLTEALGGNK